jgi:hypothetical protein
MAECTCEGIDDETKLGVSLGIDDGNCVDGAGEGCADGTGVGFVDDAGMGHRNALGGSDEMEHTVSLSHSKCADTF